MKKSSFISFVTLIVCLVSMQVADAQKSRARGNSGAGPVTPVRVGSVVLNLGAGLGAEYNGDYYRSPFGMKAAIEWGLWHAGPGTITLGAETGASFSNGGYYNDYRTSTTVIAMRSAWHYGWKVRGLDTYGGISAGIGFHHRGYRNDFNYDHNEVLPAIGAFVGASYFVAPRFGFNAEAGYDITNLQVGIIFKLR